MEKLVDLLNQFETENNDPATRENRYANRVQCYESDIISRKYLFITWLCENEFIDTERLNEENEMFRELIRKHPLDDVILMMLSIQIRPLKYLIGILK